MASRVEQGSVKTPLPRSSSTSVTNASKPKPPLGPKPCLAPKPFSLQKNASIRSIQAPKTHTTSLKSAAHQAGKSDATGIPKAAVPTPAPPQTNQDHESKPSSMKVLTKDQPKTNKETKESPHEKQSLDVSVLPDKLETVSQQTAPPKSQQSTQMPQTDRVHEQLVSQKNHKASEEIGSPSEESDTNKKEDVTPTARASSKLPWGGTRKRLSMELKSKFESGSPSVPSQPSAITHKDNDKKAVPVPSLSTPEPVNRRNDENELKEDYSGGDSIKRRISLLFDSSSKSDVTTKREEPEIINQLNDTGGVKERIKNWTLESNNETQKVEKKPQVPPRPLSKSFESAHPPTAGKVTKRSPGEVPVTRLLSTYSVDTPSTVSTTEQPAEVQVDTSREVFTDDKSHLAKTPASHEQRESTDQDQLHNFSTATAQADVTLASEASVVNEDVVPSPRESVKRRSIHFGVVERDDGGPPEILEPEPEFYPEDEKVPKDDSEDQTPVSFPVYRRVGSLQRKDDEIQIQREKEQKHLEFVRKRKEEESERARLELEEKQKEKRTRKIEEEKLRQEDRERQTEEEKQLEERQRKEECEREGLLEVQRQREQEEERGKVKPIEEILRQDREGREKPRWRDEDQVRWRGKREARLIPDGEEHRIEGIPREQEMNEEREREKDWEKEGLKKVIGEREMLREVETRKEEIGAMWQRQKDEERASPRQEEEKLRQLEMEKQRMKEEAEEKQRMRLREEEEMKENLREKEEERRRYMERKMQQEIEMERVRQEEVRRQMEEERQRQLEMERRRLKEEAEENERERLKQAEMDKLREEEERRRMEFEWKLQQEKEEREQIRLEEARRQMEEERRRQLEMERQRLKEEAEEKERERLNQAEMDKFKEEEERKIQQEKEEREQIRLEEARRQMEEERRRQLEKERQRLKEEAEEKERERLNQAEMDKFKEEEERKIQQEKEEMERIRLEEMRRHLEKERKKVQEEPERKQTEKQEEMLSDWRNWREVEEKEKDEEKGRNQQHVKDEDLGFNTLQEKPSSGESTADGTGPNLIGFDAEDVPYWSRSPNPPSAETPVVQVPENVVYEDFSVKGSLLDVPFDDFSVKPQEWASQPKVEPIPVHRWQFSRVEEEPDILVSLDVNPEEHKVGEQVDKRDTPEDISFWENPKEEALINMEEDEQKQDVEVETEDEECKGEGVEEVKSYCSDVEDKDTDALIAFETDQQYGVDETTPESDSPKAILDQVPEVSSEDADANDSATEVIELPPFPEISTPFLDNKVQKSKVELGKRRTRPTRRPRSVRAGLMQTGSQDWRTCDSTERENPLNQRDSDEEDQPKPKVVCSPPTTQRVPVIPGLSPAALLAQLKKRTAEGAEEMEEERRRDGKDSPNEEVSPSQLSRSPRSAARLAGAARVLPPLGGTDGGVVSSPAWLKELRSKKRLSQHDSET
ncbi:calponin homology domain-containing protein DDB_G0272472-like isoform X2 [Thalassophryne amazonica]|uniref:calponin homology domain-containing protein DDB_G0272472-like isoform X2 n=1 Tax=Thalassophryne amazonica TaxID=390379 RepID=UPI00147148F6|nr:calponin homology domain-containing protein DDB_G0272472-like isoform X2 [Thalassophryne amazonica]